MKAIRIKAAITAGAALVLAAWFLSSDYLGPERDIWLDHAEQLTIGVDPSGLPPDALHFSHFWTPDGETVVFEWDRPAKSTVSASRTRVGTLTSASWSCAPYGEAQQPDKRVPLEGTLTLSVDRGIQCDRPSSGGFSKDLLVSHGPRGLVYFAPTETLVLTTRGAINFTTYESILIPEDWVWENRSREVTTSGKGSADPTHSNLPQQKDSQDTTFTSPILTALDPRLEKESERQAWIAALAGGLGLGLLSSIATTSAGLRGGQVDTVSHQQITDEPPSVGEVGDGSGQPTEDRLIRTRRLAVAVALGLAAVSIARVVTRRAHNQSRVQQRASR